MEDREESVQHFLDLIKRSRRGKFKIYIGMIAGVGKSYRMLHTLLPFEFPPFVLSNFVLSSFVTQRGQEFFLLPKNREYFTSVDISLSVLQRCISAQ